MSINSRIIQWFQNRGVNDDVLNLSKIDFNGKQIVIPVFDENGNLKFNKYRRDPDSDVGPKYKYDKGSGSFLYGIFLPMNKVSKNIIICEGELDAIRLWQEDLPAVTSTGGCGTFKDEWIPFFKNKNVVICLDYDKAGIQGAYNIQSKIPWAKIIWLKKEGMDITDYIQKYSVEEFIVLLKSAKRYEIWSKQITKEYKTKKSVDEDIKKLTTYLNKILEEEHFLGSKNENYEHLTILREYHLNRLQDLKRHKKYLVKPKFKNKEDFQNRVMTAKNVPIEYYVKFNREGFAPCLWHNEVEPSMFYYKNQNKVHCFGCNQNADVIDVVQKINGVSMQEALKIILNE